MPVPYLKSVLDRGSYSFDLPVPERIPVPAIAEAWRAMIEADATAKRAHLEDRNRESAIHRAIDEDAARMAKLYESGDAEEANPREATETAEAARADSKARVEPTRRAARVAARNFKDAVDANRAEWQKKARSNAENARDKLALALKSVEVQRAELEASLGVLEMLHPEELPSSLVARWTFGNPETGVAIEALGKAVVVVDRRVREL